MIAAGCCRIRLDWLEWLEQLADLGSLGWDDPKRVPVFMMSEQGLGKGITLKRFGRWAGLTWAAFDDLDIF